MRTLVSFPRAGLNPYSNMLYLVPRAAQWRIRETSVVSRLSALVQQLDPGDVLHVQWSWPIFRAGREPEAVEELLAEFLRAVRKAKSRGVKLIWTVHNLVSHDTLYPESENQFVQFMGAESDAIVQLNTETESLFSDRFEVAHVPFTTVRHSSYQGIYQDNITRSRARDHFGLNEDEVAIGFVGQIRPYKGIDKLLAAVKALADTSQRRFKVLLGGKPQQDVDKVLKELIEREGLSAHLEFDFIQDDALQFWFHASDVMVFPYTKVLNSGSAYLSATFGTPCVLPCEPQFSTLFGEEPWVALAKDESPGSIALAIESLLDSNEYRRTQALRFARSNSPWTMSQRFWETLRSLDHQGVSS